MMEYKGYIGRCELDDEAAIISGEVINTRDVITFQGASVAEAKKAFRESIDDYLAFCKARGESPDKPLSGHFVTRISPNLHRQVYRAAALSGESLNAWVTKQLEVAVVRSTDATAGTAKKQLPSRAATRTVRKMVGRRRKPSVKNAQSTRA
jgi:predicted HicB family RNase H-like nuclease